MPRINRRDAVAEARHAELMLRIREGPGTLPRQNPQFLTTSSYGKCPIYRLFIDDLPIRNGVFFHSYVKLPKGNSIDLSFRATLSLP